MRQFQYLPFVEPFPQPQEQIPHADATQFFPQPRPRSLAPVSSLFEPVFTEHLVTLADWQPYLDTTPRALSRQDFYVRPEVIEPAPTVTVDMWLFEYPMPRVRVLPVPPSAFEPVVTPEIVPPTVICPYIPLRPAEGEKTLGQMENGFDLLGRLGDNTSTVLAVPGTDQPVGRAMDGFAAPISRGQDADASLLIAPGSDLLLLRSNETGVTPIRGQESEEARAKTDSTDQPPQKPSESQGSSGRGDECR